MRDRGQVRSQVSKSHTFSVRNLAFGGCEDTMIFGWARGSDSDRGRTAAIFFGRRGSRSYACSRVWRPSPGAGRSRGVGWTPLDGPSRERRGYPQHDDPPRLLASTPRSRVAQCAVRAVARRRPPASLPAMPKRTSPDDARMIVDASDVDEVVVDKRAGWRASPAKARRRQRRYARLLTSRLIADGGEFGMEDAVGDDPHGVDGVSPEGPRDDG